MSYNYAVQRPNVFTEDGQVMFLKIRDQAKALMETAGAASCEKLIRGCTGDSWDMLACVDRLVELHYILEVPNPLSSAGQHRLFTSFDHR